MSRQNIKKQPDAKENLLQTCYRCCTMAISSLEKVLKLTKNEQFINSLKEERQGYLTMLNKFSNLLAINGYVPKDTDALKKFMNDITFKMSTLVNKGDSSLANMSITGTSFGTIDVSRARNRFLAVEPATDFAEIDELLGKISNTVDNLKIYL
ncbi:MAG: hypothetical protein RR454_04610 [Clostridia bacterium]